MKKMIIMITVLVLLLGGCVKLAQYNTEEKSFETDNNTVSASGLSPSPSLSELTTVPVSADVKMSFDSNDVAEAESLWPFKKCGIDNFGTLTYINLDANEKYLDIMFDINTKMVFKDVKKEMDKYFNIKWEKGQTGDYDFYGKGEGRDIKGGIFFTGELSNIIMLVNCNNEYTDAVEFINSLWPVDNNIEIPNDIVMLYERELELKDSGVAIKYTYNIKHYKKIFEWYCGVMKKWGKDIPENDGKDLSAGIQIGSVYVIIEVSEKSDTVSIRYRLSEEIKF